MNVTVKLFATLRDGRFDTAVQRLPEPCSVADALGELRISAAQATLILVNHRHAELGQPLRDGDVLALFPPIGGG